MIYPGTQLTSPLVEAEWVVRALPPAEIVAYFRAQMFDICGIENRAVVLVSFKLFFCLHGVRMTKDCGGEQHAAAVMCARQLGEEMESGIYPIKVSKKLDR